MLTVVKILINCVRIYYTYGMSLKRGESVRAGFSSLYNGQMEEMSV
jgi:hypothetical protein